MLTRHNSPLAITRNVKMCFIIEIKYERNSVKLSPDVV